MPERRVEIVDEDGRITITEDVIASVARIAAERVDGIAHAASSPGGLQRIFGGEDLAPNIRAELADGAVRLELRIAVEYGYPVHEVAGAVQQNVQNDVERLSGVSVSSVNVNVKKVVPPHTHESGER